MFKVGDIVKFRPEQGMSKHKALYRIAKIRKENTRTYITKVEDDRNLLTIYFLSTTEETESPINIIRRDTDGKEWYAFRFSKVIRNCKHRIKK